MVSSSERPRESDTPSTAPGMAPHDPAVGAATITPMELFTSMMAETYMMIRLSTSPSTSFFASIRALNFTDCGPRIRSSNRVPLRPVSTAFFMMIRISSILAKTSSSEMFPLMLSYRAASCHRGRSLPWL